MVALKSTTQISAFNLSDVSTSPQISWTAQTTGQRPAHSENAGNIFWIGQSATSSQLGSKSTPFVSAKDARRQAWVELWAMLDRAHKRPERYADMTDEWLDDLRQGWDDRLDELYGADSRD